MSVDLLQAKIRKKKNPTVLGLDLQAELIPTSILHAAASTFGETAKGMAEAYVDCGQKLLDGLCDILPAVKFNTAYFEVLGADGLYALQRLCTHASAKGYYVIIETMRSDLEEAAGLQAQTYFGNLEAADGQAKIFDVDALCICAFLGSDGIRPYLPYCKERNKSIFILAKTQNKSSREVQDLISGDRVIYSVMTDLATRWGNDLPGKSGYSSLGVVIGATYPAVLREMREKYDRLFFLVPGYGEQGRLGKDVQNAFDKFGHGAVVAASGNILSAWKKAGSDGSDFVERAYEAAVKMRNDIARYVTVI